MDTVLQAVMDSARSLTHAPFASIITLDASGLVEDNLVLGFDPRGAPGVKRSSTRRAESP